MYLFHVGSEFYTAIVNENAECTNVSSSVLFIVYCMFARGFQKQKFIGFKRPDLATLIGKLILGSQ